MQRGCHDSATTVREVKRGQEKAEHSKPAAITLCHLPNLMSALLNMLIASRAR